MSDNQEVDTKDVFRIMVSTDNHLGYCEKDPIRGEDSFTAFEDMLEMAVSENVDFILLGGDLFHDAVPSQNAMHKCINLLRHYTFGDKDIPMEFLSDQTANFREEAVNYEDPNLNISIPVFSIHGNHDDPTGFGRLSSLDLLSTSGLVNYFGRWADLTKVQISPIMLRKGETQLAIYGLSHIHDMRLTRLFDSNKVNIDCPQGGDWFHLMVLHQNRADRGPKNYLPEESLPKFLNLVIWGHEHDCRIDPEYNHVGNFYVSQPGSSVPTSLAEGEAIKKHVGILEIHKNQFKMVPLPLQTVRPFIYESVNLVEQAEELGLNDGDASEKVRKMAVERVEAMIERAKELLTGHPKQPTLPLIRLRLIFGDEEQMFNALRFGTAFNERVANPGDIVAFKKYTRRAFKQDGVKFDKNAMQNAMDNMEVESTRVEDLVDRYFEEVDECKKLQLVSSKVLSEMCTRIVERSDSHAAESILSIFEESALNHLLEKLPAQDAIKEELLVVKDKVTLDDVLKKLDERGSNATVVKGTKQRKANDNSFLFSEPKASNGNAHKDDAPSSTTTARGRGGRGRGRGTRAASTTAARSTRTSGVMPKLDVTVNSSRAATQQQSLLDCIGQKKPASRSAKKVYVISSSSSESN